MSITYSEDTAHDLEEIYRYINQDNSAAAEKHRERLKKRWDASFQLSC